MCSKAYIRLFSGRTVSFARILGAPSTTQLSQLTSVTQLSHPTECGAGHVFLPVLTAQLCRAGGLISERHARNCVYAAAPIGAVRFRHNGLRPLGALGFALEPTSNGRHVPLERSPGTGDGSGRGLGRTGMGRTGGRSCVRIYVIDGVRI